jgi:hypothetical protein
MKNNSKSHKKFTSNDKKNLIQETQGRCGMCHYFPGDSIGLEIAHIIPRFKVNTDDEFNAISLCTRCHTIYDSTVISVLKTGYTKEDQWWKNKVKDQKILQQKSQKNYDDALKRIQRVREAKINILIQNGIFSRLELDVFNGLFQFQEKFEEQYDSASINFIKTNGITKDDEVRDPTSDVYKKWTEMRNKIIDDLYNKYGRNLFVVKFENYSSKLFGLDIQYHDRVHFRNLIDRKLVGFKCYQSEILANQRNLISSAGMEPRGEYASPDKMMIGIFYQNEVASNFYTYLFKELKDVLPERLRTKIQTKK